jgi:hypothetical protein
MKLMKKLIVLTLLQFSIHLSARSHNNNNGNNINPDIDRIKRCQQLATIWAQAKKKLHDKNANSIFIESILENPLNFNSNLSCDL